MGEVLLDALLDSLKIMPLLFLVYVLIEVIEEKTTYDFNKNKLLKGWVAPIVGAGVGIIPQCGFSIVAVNLFTKKRLTLGALIAVFIATSDEAIPILFSNPETMGMLIPLLLTKFLFALVVGYVIDFSCFLANRRKLSKNLKLLSDKNKVAEAKVEEQCNVVKEEKSKELNHEELNVGCCGHHLAEKKENGIKTFFLHPLLHSLKIFAYILIMNIAFGTLVYFIGEEAIKGFLLSNVVIGPLLAGIVGLIPNCVSSVLITQLFAMGGISFGACVAGLSVNAGLGILVLFKENKNIKQNILIVVGLFVVSVLFGMLLSLIF